MAMAVDSPVTVEIKSTMKRLTVEPAAAGGEPSVVRIRYSLRISYQRRLIGGSVITMHEVEEDAYPFHVDIPTTDLRLRNAGNCRDVVRRTLMELPLLRTRYFDGTDEGQWDGLVPPALVGILVSVGVRAAHDRSYRCDVWLQVQETNVYHESRELLLSCGRAVAPPGARAATAAGRRRDPGDAVVQCAICLDDEEPAAASNVDVVMELPGCRHPFHSACILTWFERAPTCPSCRRDMMQYLSSLQRRIFDTVRQRL